MYVLSLKALRHVSFLFSIYALLVYSHLIMPPALLYLVCLSIYHTTGIFYFHFLISAPLLLLL